MSRTTEATLAPGAEINASASLVALSFQLRLQSGYICKTCAVMTISRVIADGNETHRALKLVGRVGQDMMAAATAAQAVMRSRAFKTAAPHTIPSLLPQTF